MRTSGAHPLLAPGRRRASDGTAAGELDLDSFDFLQFVEELSTELDVEISERDYPKIATLDGCTAHVQQMLRHDAASAHQTTRAEP